MTTTKGILMSITALLVALALVFIGGLGLMCTMDGPTL